MLVHFKSVVVREYLHCLGQGKLPGNVGSRLENLVGEQVMKEARALWDTGGIASMIGLHRAHNIGRLMQCLLLTRDSIHIIFPGLDTFERDYVNLYVQRPLMPPTQKTFA